MKTQILAFAALFLIGCNTSPKRPTERAEYAFLQHYSEKALNDFHLQYLSLTSPPGHEIDNFGARFMTRELHTLDEARQLVKASSKCFIDEANRDRNLKKYFKNETFDLNQLDYYISFWDEHTDRPPKPYVAIATVKDGLITYYFKRDDSEFLDDDATITESFRGLGAQKQNLRLD